jgi:hypothetical protein
MENSSSSFEKHMARIEQSYLSIQIPPDARFEWVQTENGFEALIPFEIRLAGTIFAATTANKARVA